MKTVIGLFDARDKAQHAMVHLQSLGIGREQMELKPGKELLSERQRYSGEERGGGMLNRLREFLGLDTEEDELASRYDLSRVDPNDAVLVCDTSDDMADQAAEIMNRDGAVDIDQRWGSHASGMSSPSSTMHSQTSGNVSKGSTQQSATKSATTRTSGYQSTSEEERSIPEIEEELTVGKKAVARGKVRIYTVPTERTAEETVNLRSEKVHLERERVDRPIRGDETRAFENQTIEITETSEEPVVSKRARVKEEVHVRKDVEEHPQTVRETVRGTEVRVEREEEKNPRKR